MGNSPASVLADFLICHGGFEIEKDGSLWCPDSNVSIRPSGMIDVLAAHGFTIERADVIETTMTLENARTILEPPLKQRITELEVEVKSCASLLELDYEEHSHEVLRRLRALLDHKTEGEHK